MPHTLTRRYVSCEEIMKYHERMIDLKKEIIDSAIADIQFDFESAASRSESELITKLDKCAEERSILVTKCQKLEQELGNESTEYGVIFDKVIDIDLLISTYEDELISLNEMKIVSLFRLMELRIGRLIAVSFRDKAKSSYKWDDLKSYFRAKGIHISTIAFYQDVNRLRVVNNAIKHSGDISKTFRDMGCLTDDECLSHVTISDFYNKFKEKAKIFLHELADAIKLNLFVYDEDRLDTIVDSYTKTMSKETLEILSDKLKLASENIDEHVPSEFKIVLGSAT